MHLPVIALVSWPNATMPCSCAGMPVYSVGQMIHGMISRNERSSRYSQPGIVVDSSAPSRVMRASVGSLPSAMNVSRKCRSASLISTNRMESSAAAMRGPAREPNTHPHSGQRV